MAPLYTFTVLLTVITVLSSPALGDGEEDYRLPQIYDIDKYTLDLTVPPEAFTDEGNAYTGTVKISFKFTERANFIALHAHHDFIQIDSVKFNNIVLEKDDYSISSTTDILHIDLSSMAEVIQTGRIYELIIEFTGTLSTTEVYGFYKSSYVDKDGNTKFLATTQFEPTHARRAFPCFDEPGFKAVFEVSITYPKDLNVLFNTAALPPKDDDTNDDDTSGDDDDTKGDDTNGDDTKDDDTKDDDTKDDDTKDDDTKGDDTKDDDTKDDDTKDDDTKDDDTKDDDTKDDDTKDDDTKDDDTKDDDTKDEDTKDDDTKDGDPKDDDTKDDDTKDDGTKNGDTKDDDSKGDDSKDDDTKDDDTKDDDTKDDDTKNGDTKDDDTKNDDTKDDDTKNDDTKDDDTKDNDTNDVDNTDDKTTNDKASDDKATDNKTPDIKIPVDDDGTADEDDTSDDDDTTGDDDTTDDDDDDDTGLTKVSFEPTKKQSTYLLAFIISEFTCTDANKVGTVTYRVCSRDETVDERHAAVDVGPQILDKLNTFTKYDYSKTDSKLDVVAIPDLAFGAMENWGLLTFREIDLLWDDDESSNRYKQVVTTTLAHETSHQWFGDLVTCKWWSDTFLNEGFATYFEYHIPHEIYASWELDKQFVVEVLQTVLDDDELANVNALESDASTPTEVAAKFDDISYNKGASILRMIAHVVGLDNFKKGLQLYLQNNEYGSAEPTDVADALTPYIPKEIELPDKLPVILSPWIIAPGFPLLTVQSDKDNVLVSQIRFVISEDTDDKASLDTKWYVPISYTTSEDEKKFEDTSAKYWLVPGKNLTIPLPEKATWIILNNQQTGYYRVNYDDTLWGNIKDALQSDNFGGITDLNRAQIADDLFSLAKVGIVSYSDAFDITSFLADDTSYYSWYPVFNEFDFLLRRVGEDSDLGKKIKEALMDLMDNLYKSVPFKQQKADDQIYTLKQDLALTWACKIGHDDCVDNAKQQFDQYVSTNERPDKNLRTVVYCNGVRYSENNTGWEFLWDAYNEAADLPSEQITILAALGCSKDTDLLKDYLKKTIDDDSGIRTQDAIRVFSAVYSGNPEGVGVAYDFLTENYKKIGEKYQSANALGSLITGIAERFTTEEEVNKLKDFVKKEDLPDALKSATNQAIAIAESNQKWLAEYEGVLKDYYSAAPHLSASLLVILLAIVVNQMFFS